MATFFKVAPPPLKRCILLRRTARLKTKKQRSFATDQDPLGENYICDHCHPLLRNHKTLTPKNPPNQAQIIKKQLEKKHILETKKTFQVCSSVPPMLLFLSSAAAYFYFYSIMKQKYRNVFLVPYYILPIYNSKKITIDYYYYY